MFLFPSPQMLLQQAPVVGGAGSGSVAAAAPAPVVAYPAAALASAGAGRGEGGGGGGGMRDVSHEQPEANLTKTITRYIILSTTNTTG